MGLKCNFLPKGDLMPTWTTQAPSQPGWYWMLNLSVKPSLPTIVNIVREWQTGRWLALIPASLYPKASEMVVEVQHLDAMWAGPVQIPSLHAAAHQNDTSVIGAELSPVV